jgi:formyltetrahydrofolate deformylase
MSTTATSWVLSLSCPDQPGIVAAVAGLLAEHGGNITESQQFGDPLSGLFFMRVEVEAATPRADLESALAALAPRFGLQWSLDVAGRKMRTLLLGSTTAHCVNDLAFRQRSEGLPIDIVGLVSNHTVLSDMAAFYDIPFHHVPVTKDTKAQAEAELLRLVEELDVELVVLARYMQILSDDLCRALAGRVIKAHDRGVKLIGATAHYVTGDLDEGPIIEQDVERVDHTRGVEDLVALGQDVERRALARAVRWHAEHRVLLDGHRTIVFR